MEPRGHWYRSYEEMSKDPKFRSVARRASEAVPGVRVSDAIAVWVNLLERASAAFERGAIEGFDGESVDDLFDMPIGAACALVDAFKAKGMIEDGFIAKWSARQPQRERPNDDSSERVKAFRERKRNENLAHVTPCNASVTPCNTPDQNRLEQRREEDSLSSSVVLSPAPAPAAPVAEDFESEVQSFPELDSMPIEFQDLAKGYPGPVDTVPAYSAFMARRKDPRFQIQRVLDDVCQREKSEEWTKDGGRWIPKLSKYLAEERWKDRSRASPQETYPWKAKVEELDRKARAAKARASA